MCNCLFQDVKIKIKLELKKINCFLEISTYNVMGEKKIDSIILEVAKVLRAK